MTKFQDVIEFVTKAERNRKYPEGTAQSLRAALRLYEKELKSEESASLELFEKNFEQITRSVFSKNDTKFSASSLATYRSRVQKAIADFKKYNDPVKMNGWQPKVIVRAKRSDSGAKRKGKDSSGQGGGSDNAEAIFGEGNEVGGVELHQFSIVVRPGVKALVRIPHDLTAAEAKKIKGLIDSLTVDA